MSEVPVCLERGATARKLALVFLAGCDTSLCICITFCPAALVSPATNQVPPSAPPVPPVLSHHSFLNVVLSSSLF